ncbi:hypothetical protein BGZ83_002278 [Gryganskiella cystojenkinii]|nr:hypothetical protein BGZ83_002278 [Gryganskiella cystojenkinii]
MEQIILPTGRSSWGYDWHGASIKNVMNAVLSLRDYLPGVPQALRDLHGMQPDADRILMAGHSNGGQGAWYWATHFPDLAIAVTPAAGYVNIKQYVSYSGWLSNSHTDSHLRGLLESSITEYDNDVHISNVVGIPIMARTGSVDNNVPPLNSRKMVRLVQENAHNMSSSKLSEIHGEGHCFEINLVNPAGMGSRAGILVEQLRIPYRKGTIKVEIIDNPTEEPDSSSPTTSWVLKSTNIRRFRFVDSTAMRKRMTGSSVSQFVLDGVRFYLGEETGQISMSDLAQGTFLRSSGSQGQKELWKFSNSEDWLHTERHRETYGPAIQILEKRVIVVLGTAFDHDSSKELSKAADRIAKLIAHDIFLYGRGDVAVMTDREYQETILLRSDQQEPVLNKANLILIGDAHQNSVAKHVLEQRASEVTIDTTKGLISVQPSGSSVDMETETEFREPGTGLLMIRPWGPSNLAMIIAGLDVQGLDMASRLFPKRTGLLVSSTTEMKSFRYIIVLATLSGMQLLCGAQAQTPSWLVVNAAAASSSLVNSIVPTSTSAVVPTPTVPAFVNTPGLRVYSPYDGMQVTQGAYLSISASLTSGQPIGSITITVAKADGSSNVTIVSVASANTLSLIESWNVQTTVGNYLMNMIVTPNTTVAAPVTSLSAVVPAPTSAPGTGAGGASIYYWQGRITVKALTAPPPTYGDTNGAAVIAPIATLLATIASTAVVLGSALLL